MLTKAAREDGREEGYIWLTEQDALWRCCKKIVGAECCDLFGVDKEKATS